MLGGKLTHFGRSKGEFHGETPRSSAEGAKEVIGQCQARCGDLVRVSETRGGAEHHLDASAAAFAELLLHELDSSPRGALGPGIADEPLVSTAEIFRRRSAEK